MTGYWHCRKCDMKCRISDESHCPNSRTTSMSHDWEWIQVIEGEIQDLGYMDTEE